MAKIDGSTQGQFRSTFLPGSRKKKKSLPVFGGVLGKLMSGSSKAVSAETSDINTDEELRAVIDSIHQLGENLLKYPGPDILAQYKQSVRDFIAHVTRKTYSTEEYVSRKNILKQKRYVLIQTIDTKLDALSRTILSSQKQQVDMLSNIEEIQGLLIDMIHVS